MSQSKKILFTFYAIGICSISFLFFSSSCLAATASNTRDPISLHIQDPESLISQKLKAKTLVRKGPSSTFVKRTIEAGKSPIKGRPNPKSTLGDIERTSFRGQYLFRNKLKNLSTGSNGILYSPPIIKDMTYEFEDSFLLIKSTSINVNNPRQLASQSPQFRAFLGKQKRPGSKHKKILPTLKPESLKGLNDFIKNELPRRHATDPIKIAAKKGKEALLQAIVQGYGLFETVEELCIPKRLSPVINGVQQLPVYRNGILNYNLLQPSKRRLLSKSNSRRIINEDLVKRLSDTVANSQTQQETHHSTRMVKTVNKRSGSVSAQFLTGYEPIDPLNWEYHRKWKFWSGSFRAKAHAGYDFAFRFSIEVTAEINPAGITLEGANDRDTPLTTTLSARPLNGDCEFFQKAGLDPDRLPGTCGKELALYFGFGYGFNFRALWTTVIPMDYQTHDFDRSKDFIPPFDNNRGGVPIEIPPSWTNTDFNIGVIKGELTLLLLLGGEGKINLDYESFYNYTGQAPVPVTARRTLAFDSPNDVIIRALLPKHNYNHSAVYNYGIKLSRPKYKIKPTITPGMNLSVTAGYKDFSRTFTCGPKYFRAARISLPSVTFNSLSGSSSRYSWNDGRKYFKKR